MSIIQRKTEWRSTEGIPDNFTDILYSLLRLFKSFHQSKWAALPDVWGFQILHCPSIPPVMAVWLSQITSTSNGKVLNTEKNHKIRTISVNGGPSIQQLADFVLLSSPGQSYIFFCYNRPRVTSGSGGTSHHKWVTLRWHSLMPGCKEKTGPDFRVLQLPELVQPLFH